MLLAYYYICHKTQRLYLLRNLLLSIAFLATLYFCFSWFLPGRNAIPFFVGILLLVLSEQVLLFKIRQVKVDAEQKSISFMLGSIFSGLQEKSFALDAIKSTSINNTSLNRWRNGAVTLEIQVSEKQYFRLTSRYGFNAKDLLKLNENIKAVTVAANL